jgi:protein-tyrosine-phosphatase
VTPADARDERVPVVVFLCVHNAGRSQMALGWLTHLAGDRAVARSGGSEPAPEVNPIAVAAMAEVGIDIAREHPNAWTDEVVRAADVVVTMGCGDTCPLYPGKRYEDWELDDPAVRADAPHGREVAPCSPACRSLRPIRVARTPVATHGLGDETDDPRHPADRLVGVEVPFGDQPLVAGDRPQHVEHRGRERPINRRP